LENTHEKTISPEYDLAYMALLNEKEKDDQDEPKTVIQQDGVVKNSDEKKDNSEQGANEEGGVSNANNTTVVPDDLPPAYEDIDETITSLDPPQDQPESSTRAAVTKTKERPSVDAMMFGKQQDVTGREY
jgi:hypothetical protein